MTTSTLVKATTRLAMSNFDKNAYELMLERLSTTTYDKLDALLHSVALDWKNRDDFLRPYRTLYSALACLYTQEFDELNEQLSLLGDNQGVVVN